MAIDIRHKDNELVISGQAEDYEAMLDTARSMPDHTIQLEVYRKGALKKQLESRTTFIDNVARMHFEDWKGRKGAPSDKTYLLLNEDEQIIAKENHVLQKFHKHGLIDTVHLEFRDEDVPNLIMQNGVVISMPRKNLIEGFEDINNFYSPTGKANHFFWNTNSHGCSGWTDRISTANKEVIKALEAPLSFEKYEILKNIPPKGTVKYLEKNFSKSEKFLLAIEKAEAEAEVKALLAKAPKPNLTAAGRIKLLKGERQ
jgi:hypothetical protein